MSATGRAFGVHVLRRRCAGLFGVCRYATGFTDLGRPCAAARGLAIDDDWMRCHPERDHVARAPVALELDLSEHAFPCFLSGNNHICKSKKRKEFGLQKEGELLDSNRIV
ncbi:hypothetical protein IWX90DRAFT_416617 [Phyllosticta citrichinensis]|uniref:Uncharacterized protein n=1 Tax=Phyllosticta citrichinensis TaxID=1130410 RepID=A0ABR1XN81_9PEZI